jgi:hypothetical protein
MASRIMGMLIAESHQYIGIDTDILESKNRSLIILLLVLAATPKSPRPTVWRPIFDEEGLFA